MNTPTCHFCAQTPMLPKVRIPISEKQVVVIFQCPQCQRIAEESK